MKRMFPSANMGDTSSDSEDMNTLLSFSPSSSTPTTLPKKKHVFPFTEDTVKRVLQILEKDKSLALQMKSKKGIHFQELLNSVRFVQTSKP